MKFEDARASVLVYCCEVCGKIELCRCRDNECVEALIVQALDKQIPKKPKIYITDWPGCCKVSKCPSCGQEFGFNDGFNFCENCGQEIDWSEVSE